MLQDHIDRFQPADGVEMECILQMVAYAWRFRRMAVIESSTFDLEMQGNAMR